MERHDQTAVLVCVTDQLACERLIEAGKKLSDMMGVRLEVLSVQSNFQDSAKKSEALEYLYDIAVQNGASMTIYYHSDSVLMAAGHIAKHKISNVVTGMPANSGIGFVQVLKAVCPEVSITMVADDNKTITLEPSFEYAGVVSG